MALTTTAKARYSAVSMLFHWTIAIAVIVNWRIAEAAEHAEGPAKGAIFNNHKALGITILLLTLGRIAWRLSHPMPALPANYARWETVLARGTHMLFYILLIGLPLGGWIANSMAGRDIDFFSLFTIPPLPIGENKALGGAIFDAHAAGGTFLLALIALHVLGALKHTFIDRDGGIFRMLPFGRVNRAGE
jgi:cytochrome b561